MSSRSRAAQGAAQASLMLGANSLVGLVDGRDNALREINDAQPRQLSALEAGNRQARTDYERGRDLFTPYAADGRRARDAQMDALGLNGAEGYDRAVGRFRESPGYRYRVDQALDGVNRAQSATGMLASGNTLTALQDRAANLADQEWDADYARLGDLAGQGFQATGAMAAFDRGLGDMSAQYGRDQADIFGNNARSRANLYSGTASSMAQSNANTMQGLNDAYRMSIRPESNSGSTASNLLRAGGTILGAAVGGPMGTSIGSSIGSAAGNLFTGGGGIPTEAQGGYGPEMPASFRNGR